ncbi:MAG: hypothetical protein R2788_06185 [Saprospiraceae bacterium]
MVVVRNYNPANSVDEGCSAASKATFDLLLCCFQFGNFEVLPQALLGKAFQELV